MPERAHVVHTELVALCQQLKVAERRAAELLVEVDADRLYRDLGHASLADYAVAELDLHARKAEELLRIGRKLAELPRLDQAFAEGQVAWTKVREVTRVATPDTDAAWTELAATSPSRVVERAVRDARNAAADPHVGAALTRVVVQCTASEAETLRALLQWMRGRAALSGEDDEAVRDGALLAMAAQRLMHDAPPAEAPTSERHRIVLAHCPDCRQTTTLHGAPADDTTVLEARCSGDVVDLRPGPKQGYLTSTIPPATRRAVLLRDLLQCRVPGCTNCIWIDLHHVRPRHWGGGHEPENLLTLCSVHHDLVHEGLLAVRRIRDGFEFEFGSGRVVRVPFDPRTAAPAAA